MNFEKSCGAVIFRKENGLRKYLVLRSVGGHVTLCKGHVEGSETEHETATREIMEETALSVKFVDGFRQVITYSPKPDCMKDVVFFLAQVTGGVLTCQPEEVADARFAPFCEAIAALTHTSDREVLEKAECFLISGSFVEK
jgi:8-oxo-dGTP pyrophosphatase MutT (NUDIX family)